MVDDDAAIRSLIKDKLDRAGFEVLTAASGQDAMHVIARHGLPHLAIVDLMMPGMDGFEFCQSVQQFSDLPIIMLSADHEEETIIRGIRYFAEDYITKPFSPSELLVRVERVLRRIGDFAYTLTPVMRVDDRVTVDFAHKQICVDGEMALLTPTETKLLYILMRNAGRVVTTDFLLRRLWPMQEVYEDALYVHIRHLRQKIESDPGEPRYIVTERGLGYTFGFRP
ncbi:MAG: response regulator transcription factor [Anaerolineae bacterium]|nr:response regulator transcription factor [Anaerolineae bacterium]